MYATLAVLLIAVGGFSVAVVCRPAPGSPRLDRTQLRGFSYVGGGALLLVAAAVVLIGIVRPGSAQAETLAVLSLFGYVLYLGIAMVILLGRR